MKKTTKRRKKLVPIERAKKSRKPVGPVPKIPKCRSKPKFGVTDKHIEKFRKEIEAAEVSTRYLYHVTPTTNVKRILKSGLVPKKYDKRCIGIHPPVVFVGSKWRTIIQMAKEDYCIFRPGPWALLRIDVKKLPKMCLFHDKAVPKVNGWFWTAKAVPPAAIAVHSLFKVVPI